MAKKDNQKITILIPVEGTSGATESFPDRMGGQRQSAVTAIKRFFVGETDLDVETLTKGLDDCLTKMGAVFANLKEKAVDGWEVDTVAVSLGISAEGSIGVVTAGVEGSIQVTFKRT